jgi:hypothetical protein
LSPTAPAFRLRRRISVDVEVDPDDRRHHASLRYTVVSGRRQGGASDCYVEGQYQGGAAQGIGWALERGIVYGADGRLQNPGYPRLSRAGLPPTCR